MEPSCVLFVDFKYNPSTSDKRAHKQRSPGKRCWIGIYPTSWAFERKKDWYRSNAHKTSTIVFGLLCCSIHLVSLIFFPRSDQRFYNILGVFCSGFLVVAHFWKLSHLYLPFLLYNSVDFARNNLMILFVAYALLCGDAEVQRQACESFGCTDPKMGESRNIEFELLIDLILRVFGSAFMAWFEFVVLFDAMFEAYIRRLLNVENT
ncbi:hypothetical protein DdX_14341 [Ditylenchus destructor]|uniref:Uncharacterized protein n=1 Tax=Ditylenchus destructor TaxID=166010 RepID=A0AAD4QYQ6_9BILA|nr:hypothetical protein DdX_14340 [Ditylenchus destructor]KAI1704344.1 hypothetical protein DdX_14341 [Ditylenchus destructor]